MFDKKKFANIIKQINDTYENQRKFSALSGINRTYLSQYMNMKLNEPPKPKILKKLALSSKNLVSYEELMITCGYTDSNKINIAEIEDSLDKIENNFLNYISEIKLSKKDEQIFNDLCKIIDVYSFEDLTDDEFHKKLVSYFDNMDYLSNSSKEKIEKKLSIFIKYCTTMDNVREELLEKKANNSLGFKTTNISKKFYMTPVYGQISAGQPNWAEECLEGYLPIDPALMGIINPEECFFLKVDGESMNKVIRNGAYALIRKQDIVEDGDIAVVLVNGDNATIKRFTRQGDFIFLEPMSTDESIKRQIYDKTTPIKILGKYIGKFEIN